MDLSSKSILTRLASEGWTILEDSIEEVKLRFQETIFTIGNGFVGSRGILEEGYSQGYAGTYIAGIYDRSEGQSYEIVNAPNPICVEVTVNGKKLSKDNMQVIEHSRILNLQKAMLQRHSIFADSGGRYEYESMRFFSLSDMHIGVMTFSLALLDADAHVIVKIAIDGSTRNELRAVGGPIKHYSITETSNLGNEISYLEAKTNDLGILIGLAIGCEMKNATSKLRTMARSYTDGELVIQEFSFDGKKGCKYQFNNYIAIYTSRELERSPKTDCLSAARMAKRLGVSGLLKRHINVWARRWEYSDIEIEGDPLNQKALRFDIYHLLIVAPPEDLDVSIAPKALSSEWYNGHVFWDTEIHMLPFFTYTQPKVARGFLMYRYRRLEQARQGALCQGYKGALWPWESASSGKDETPQTWINFDGTKIPVYNSIREHHIVSDVTYALLSYYEASGDEEFMLQCGAEMVFEAARFWASRSVYDRRRKQHVIKEVIGPNEFQESVDNNSYTNYMAKWVLKSGSELYNSLKNKHPRTLRTITKKIKLQAQEADIWKELSDKIVFLIDSKGLIEEFEGYFGKKGITISEWDENDMPVWPSAVKLAEVKETQLIKQADVMLLLNLFSNAFSLNVKKINLEYYEKRTVHKSSLSIPSYAIIALEIGEVEKAYRRFALAVKSDLYDIYRNTNQGIHAAAIGGAWQVAIRGFGGIRLKEGLLIVNPTLPNNWTRMRFCLWFKNSLIEFVLLKREITAIMLKGQAEVEIELYGNKYCLCKGHRVYAKED